jgi:hypothetical protein
VRHPDQVRERLESWRKRLACRWDDHDDEPVNVPAARRMRDLLGEVVWRDMIGYIPLYTLVLAFGQWFLASQILRRHGGIYDYWWALPALALASDYLEDFCHLRYRTLHAAGAKPSAMLSTFSRSMSMIKFAAVSVSALLTGFAALAATYSRRGPRREMEAPLVRRKVVRRQDGPGSNTPGPSVLLPPMPRPAIAARPPRSLRR